uniref:Uncharacterized protein n=1 Tax=Photinus pyralis TaxID=7054 RepID=A0A1Y1NBI8_PHOPY
MNKLNSVLKLGNTIKNVNCNTISIKSSGMYKVTSLPNKFQVSDFWKTYIRGASMSSGIKRVAINKKSTRYTSKRFTRCVECQPRCASKRQKAVEDASNVINDECKPTPVPKKIDECEIKIAKSCTPNPCEFVCSGVLVVRFPLLSVGE